MLVAENHGRRLIFAEDLDDGAFASAVALLTHLLTIRRKISIDTIDGASPNESPYLVRFADKFDVARDHRRVELLLPANTFS